MSLFLGQTSQYSYATVDPQKIQLAEIQFTATAHTFNKLLKKCSEKCLVHHYGEGELSKGETECIDRCIVKYLKANYIVGDKFQKMRMDPNSSMPDYQYVKNVILGNGSSNGGN